MKAIYLLLFVFFLNVMNTSTTPNSDNNKILLKNFKQAVEISVELFDYDDKNNTELFLVEFDSMLAKQPYTDSASLIVENTAYAKEILKKYFASIGGEELLRSVNDRIIDMKGIVQGLGTEIVFYQKAPNKLCQQTFVGDVEQKIIFDGNKGVKIVGDIIQEMTGNELTKLNFDAIMNLLLEPEQNNVLLKYKGMEKINERDCYTILFTLPNGAEWYQYFDLETGLKVRDSKDIITSNGKFKQITEFGDYRTVDGIRYPFKIKQYLGNQILDFTIQSIKVNTGIPDEIFQID